MQYLALFMAALSVAGAAGLLWPLFRPAGRDHPVAGQLPALWRAAWPWLNAAAPAAGALLSWQRRKRWAAQMLRAGLPERFSAGHLAAAHGFGAMVGALSASAALLASGGGMSGAMALAAPAGGAFAGFIMPALWLRAAIRERAARMARELPFLLDMTTLCVESGLNLQGALQQAARHGPAGPLRDELLRALSDMRAGLPRVEALNAWSSRVDLQGVRALTMALAQADAMGMSLGPILRAQSDRRRAERFNRAEKLALQAPVKMLFPLICCIFPCAFIVLGFPIAAQFMRAVQ
ncbi:type II secretion system F family protein [Bordetella genomosp. 9]|uniref:Type II secretion system protein GspF domain-containing protein n=1 Tax=Bordetella genomosp. 9 TaxID=1416803 RepID=A0A1W6Z1R1_9BORD|nr:type II secretion system F family protein [Bordetella genomosp. 9]ARP87124.1 hypothetical protein CAL13_13590 [Bordetella genomosp. 9]